MLTKDQLYNLRKLVESKKTLPKEGVNAEKIKTPGLSYASKQIQILKKSIREQPGDSIENFVKIKRSIAVCSGKGGVGKSNLTVNLAILLSSLGKRTVVIDADLGLANDDILLGIRPKAHLYHFLCGQKSIDEILIEGPSGMKLLPGGSGISELANIREFERKQILSGLVGLAQKSDIILIDTSAGISKNVLNFVTAAEDTLLVVNPEPTSMLDAFGMLKSIVKSGKRDNIFVVVNKARNEEEGEKTFKRLKKTAEKFLLIDLKYGGFIYEDGIVSDCVRKQTPFVVRNPESMASYSLNEVLKRIFGLTGKNNNYTPKNENSLLSFFRRLVETFEV